MGVRVLLRLQREGPVRMHMSGRGGGSTSQGNGSAGE